MPSTRRGRIGGRCAYCALFRCCSRESGRPRVSFSFSVAGHLTRSARDRRPGEPLRHYFQCRMTATEAEVPSRLDVGASRLATFPVLSSSGNSGILPSLAARRQQEGGFFCYRLHASRRLNTELRSPHLGLPMPAIQISMLTSIKVSSMS